VSPAAITDDLVGVKQIGELGGFTRQRAQALARRDDFPRPVMHLPDGQGRRLWARRDITAWLERRAKATEASASASTSSTT